MPRRPAMRINKIFRTEEIDMRTLTTEKNNEARMLCAITLTCYVTVLAGLLAMGYSMFSLAAHTLDENIFVVYSRQGF
jgi:predicted transcriptional regulator